MGPWIYYLFVPTAKNIVLLTVLSAKSDSDVMIGLQSYQGLIINRSPVYSLSTLTLD